MLFHWPTLTDFRANVREHTPEREHTERESTQRESTPRENTPAARDHE